MLMKIIYHIVFLTSVHTRAFGQVNHIKPGESYQHLWSDFVSRLLPRRIFFLHFLVTHHVLLSSSPGEAVVLFLKRSFGESVKQSEENCITSPLFLFTTHTSSSSFIFSLARAKISTESVHKHHSFLSRGKLFPLSSLLKCIAHFMCVLWSLSRSPSDGAICTMIKKNLLLLHFQVDWKTKWRRKLLAGSLASEENGEGIAKRLFCNLKTISVHKFMEGSERCPSNCRDVYLP